jgi:hypothetical protein
VLRGREVWCPVSNEDKKQRKKERKFLKSCEHKSDRRTAEFVVRQLGELQDQMCDLISDLRTFEHYSEIEDLGWCLMLMQKLKRKYRRFVEDGVWPDSS